MSEHDSETASTGHTAQQHAHQAPLPKVADTGKPRILPPGTTPQPKHRPEAGPDQSDRGGEAYEKHDLVGRIVGRPVMHGVQHVLIGLGARHGVPDQSKGYIVTKEGKHTAIKVIHVDPLACLAVGDGVNIMEWDWRDHQKVVLNPSPQGH
jgi:hypothetical protein